MSPSNNSYVSNIAIFHFYDYGRKSIYLHFVLKNGHIPAENVWVTIPSPCSGIHTLLDLLWFGGLKKNIPNIFPKWWVFLDGD